MATLQQIEEEMQREAEIDKNIERKKKFFLNNQQTENIK